MKPSPAGKKLRSHSTIPTTNKKLNELKNQQLLLDPSKKWGHRTNQGPQNFRDARADTENYNFPKEKSMDRDLQEEEGVVRKAWSITDELLKASPGGHSHSGEVARRWGGVYTFKGFTSSSLTRCHSEDQRKFSCAPDRERGEKTIS